jgi:hypothetical protein
LVLFIAFSTVDFGNPFFVYTMNSGLLEDIAAAGYGNFGRSFNHPHTGG